MVLFFVVSSLEFTHLGILRYKPTQKNCSLAFLASSFVPNKEIDECIEDKTTLPL